VKRQPRSAPHARVQICLVPDSLSAEIVRSAAAQGMLQYSAITLACDSVDVKRRTELPGEPVALGGALTVPIYTCSLSGLQT